MKNIIGNKNNIKKVTTKLIPLFLIVFLILFINSMYFTTFVPIGQSGENFFESSLLTNQKEHVKLSIVIDDFGQSRKGFKEMMSIGKHLTFAVMPFLEYSSSDAEDAFKKGYEVIIHLPMEPNRGKPNWLGPRPILTALNDHEVQQIVMDSFKSVPYAVGVNIHMGSKASEDARVMADILDVVKVKGVYFLDSKTSSKKIAKEVAKSKNVLFFERDVFLDSSQSKEFVKKRLKQAGNLAMKKGYAIAIGHIGIEGGKVTADAINETLPWFEENNIDLVFVSELIKIANK